MVGVSWLCIASPESVARLERFCFCKTGVDRLRAFGPRDLLLWMSNSLAFTGDLMFSSPPALRGIFLSGFKAARAFFGEPKLALALSVWKCQSQLSHGAGGWHYIVVHTWFEHFPLRDSWVGGFPLRICSCLAGREILTQEFKWI